jgi:hypothetical protein
MGDVNERRPDNASGGRLDRVGLRAGGRRCRVRRAVSDGSVVGKGWAGESLLRRRGCGVGSTTPAIAQLPSTLDGLGAWKTQTASLGAALLDLLFRLRSGRVLSAARCGQYRVDCFDVSSESTSRYDGRAAGRPPRPSLDFSISVP